MKLSNVKNAPKIANSDNYVLSEYDFTDFIYSVTLKQQDTAAEKVNIVFGADSELENYWLLTIDFVNDQIVLGNQDMKEIKTVSFSFAYNTDYKINIVVNDNIAKVYVDKSDIASLVMGLGVYSGGRIGEDLEASHFTYSKVSTSNLDTLEGDIFCSGYDVLKVVNLTDNNYCLKETEYSFDGLVVSVEEDYLKTLENSVTYKFRAVTTLTDFDFYVTTGDVGAQVTSAVNKYYRGDDLRFELSENTAVFKSFIDNQEFAFTQNNELVTIASSELTTLGSGEHTVKLFTQNGRPEAKFSLYEVVEVIPEVPAPVNHAFFFIDIAIFAVLILGYVAFSQIKKHSK